MSKKLLILSALVGSIISVNLELKNKGLYDGTKFNVKVENDKQGTKCGAGQVAIIYYTGKTLSDEKVFD